jgi:hypothetical protein
LTTRAPEARRAISSAAEVVWPMAKPLRSALSGLVQSIRILPVSGPAAFSASSTDDHGGANKMVSPNPAASAGVPAQAPGPSEAA